MGAAKDKIKGGANEAIGKVKKAVGDLTDNKELRAKGTVQQAKGTVQKSVGNLKTAVKNASR